MTNQPNNRKEQEKDARKKDILDAAATLFAENGFHQVKMDTIAENVGLSKGTLYLYFENKEKLFFAILKDRSDKLFEQIQTAIQSYGSFKGSLRQFIQTYFGFFQKHKAFFKILQTEKSRMSMESHYEMHEWGLNAFHNYFHLVIQLIKKGQKEGFVKEMDPMSAAKILGGGLNSYIFHRIFLGSNKSLEEDTDNLIDLFLNGVRAET